MHFCPENDSQYASTGVILSYMQMSEVEQWKGTKIADEVRTTKNLRRERLRKCWMCWNNISLIYVHKSKPITPLPHLPTLIIRVQKVAQCTVMFVSIHLGSACRVPQRTKVPNLYLTGQNVNSHGMLGVLVGAIVTCSELLTAKKIYEQIKEANK